MKILFLTNIPSPYRVDFFNELGKLCDLTVLYELRNAKDRSANWMSCKSETFKEVFLEGKAINNDSAICINVIKWLKSESFDHIIIGVYSSPTSMIAIKYLISKKIPFIISCDGGFAKNDNKIKYNIKRYFISKANAWLSTAKQTNLYLKHYGADDTHIYLYPFTSIRENDIIKKMLTKEEKLNIRSKLKVYEDKLIITVGQFIHRKGFDVLLNACGRINENIGVYIIGGEPTQEYISLKEKLKLNNVHFIGFKTKEELKKYYLSADIFVLPTREDIWGLVINEAMAYGLPIITTDRCIAGLELIEENENGFIVPSDDIQALAEKMRMLVNDNDAMDRISKNNHQKIQQYTIEKMASRHVEIFDIINKKNSDVVK